MSKSNGNSKLIRVIVIVILVIFTFFLMYREYEIRGWSYGRMGKDNFIYK